MEKRDTNRRAFALRVNRWMLGFSRNWLRVVLTVLSIYVILPFTAPVLMKAGITGPARVIYTIYAPFCHQFAFRSFFLFGEQPVYPRSNANSDWTPFEAYANDLLEFENVDFAGFDLDLISAARGFVGNEQMGYKITLCERDIFIYMTLLAGGLVYALPAVRRRLRPVPLWLYVILGLGPIGLDGFSQLLGYPPFELWPARETLPEFRVVTGILFGFMNAWLGFPYLEIAMRDTRREVEAKLRRAGILA